MILTAALGFIAIVPTRIDATAAKDFILDFTHIRLPSAMAASWWKIGPGGLPREEGRR
jgi:hypothetical protein